MRIVLLLCLASSAVWGNACTDTATGNWNTAATWATCGGTFPGNGDTVTISGAHTITITSDVGTNAAGLAFLAGGSIAITGASSVLTSDGAAHTIYLGSTGTTCGTNVAVILHNKGTVTLSNITITAPNGTFPWAIHHTQFASAATMTLSHMIFVNFGTGLINTECVGIADTTTSSSLAATLDHITFTGGGNQTIQGGNSTSIHDSTWNGRAYYGFWGYNQAATPFTNNTDLSPATAGLAFYHSIQSATASLISGNFCYQDSLTQWSQCITDQTAAAVTLQTIYSYNGCYYPPSTNATTQVCLIISSPSSGPVESIDHNVAANAYWIISIPSLGTISQNWAGATNVQLGGQGQFEGSAGGPSLMQRNVVVYDSVSTTTNLVGVLKYNAGAITIDSNTFVYPTTGAFNANQAINIGDTGGGPVTAAPGASVSNNLCYLGGNCVNDTVTAGTNVFSTLGTGGVGVWNNSIFGTTSPYLTQGGIHFGTHPSATSNDLAINPGFVSITRRYADFDAYLGGPGTAAHLALMLAYRSGLDPFTLTPVSFDPRYSMQALWQYLMAGLAPRNSVLGNASSLGGVVGAVPPVVMGAWAQ